MKVFIFLIVIVAVVSVMILKMRKTQAEADLVRQKAIELRKQKEKELMTPEQDMIWPVVGISQRDDPLAGEESASEEPSMTSIEYEPPEQIAS